MVPAEVTKELLLEWRAPRLGASNPERLTNPVWAWLARDPDITAYRANELGGAPQRTGPTWCNNRFGQSHTELGGGRTIALGGEHEDYYDPDFYIYNDAIVRGPDDSIEIYGYPRDAFPPTDFHTATLVGDRIILIGCLGYADQRGSETQLLALDATTLAMSRLVATGPSPGWLYKHSAELDAAASTIIVRRGMRMEQAGELENIDDYALALDTMVWTRLTARTWSFWRLARDDGRQSQLWRIGSFAWRTGERREAAVAELGFEPDLDRFAARFAPPIEHVVVPRDDGDDLNVTRIDIDGVIVRYVETIDDVVIAIEGELPELTARRIVEDARQKLAAVEHAPYVARRVR